MGGDSRRTASRFGEVGGGDVLATATVLIVDDYEPNVVALEAMLRSAGVARVESLTDARQVVEVCHHTSFDLVLLDWHMPVMDGLAVLRDLPRVVARDEYLPVIVLTADDTAEVKQEALAAGAKDFLTKPFDATEVVLRVKNLLETRALHTRLRARNADLSARLEAQARRDRRQGDEQRAKRARIRRVLAGHSLSMVFQPIADLSNGGVTAVEALARFAAEPVRAPQLWFAEAAEVGLARPLELAAAAMALSHLDDLPPGMSVAINASPAIVTTREFADLVASSTPERLVVELTEHVAIDDYETVIEALRPLRDLGLRIAVDDTGAGFATLQHILTIRPDIIKLDIALTRGIDNDPVRRALARALVCFAGEISASIVAEGIETAGELRTLTDLGVHAGQGFFLARPGPAALIARHVDPQLGYVAEHR